MQPNEVKQIKDTYKPGMRIELDSMDDPYAPIPSGTQGVVDYVDDAGQIHMKWDNGRSLALVPYEDSFHIVREVEENVSDSSQTGIDLNQFTQEVLTQRLRTRLVNYERNKEEMDGVVHRRIDDLALYTVAMIDEEHFFKITQELMEGFGLSTDQLFDVAMENTRADFTLDTLEHIAREIMEDFSEEELNELPFSPPFVLTNHNRIFGAALIADPVVMEEVKEQMNGAFYVLPSSTHEVIIMSMEGNAVTELQAMVQEVNERHVDRKEQLSNHVYECDGATLSIAVKELETSVDSNRTENYVDYINENILPNIDYELLQASYQSEDKSYAKSILNALHKAAIEQYGTNYFDGHDGNEYVLLPGVVRGKKTGNMGIVLLEIDLLSSGEHCGTDFLTKYGVLNQFDDKRPEMISAFLSETYGSYDYAYTLIIENDHHVDFEDLHPDIAEMLNTFEAYSIEQQNNQEQNSSLPSHVVRGYVYDYQGNAESFWFENSAKNMADFIMLHPYCREVVITDAVDQFILQTRGNFLDRCADMDVRNEVVRELIPMQMGELDTESLSLKVWDNDMNEHILQTGMEEDIER